MGKTVLVVDDNELMRTLVARALVEQGLEVATARSGAEALAQLATTSYDLIVADYVMPGMCGDELTRAVRRHARAEVRGIPVIGLCGSHPDAEALFQAAGVAACIAKPVNDRDLVAAVRRVLGGASPPEPTPAPRPRGD